MNSSFLRFAAGLAAVVLLGAPLSVRAAAMPAITQAQKSAAATELSQALKTAGASSLTDATPKQLNAAVAGVLAKNRGSKSFLGALTEVLVQGRPELTVAIVKTLIAAVTPPGECPPAVMVEEIIAAAVKANPAAGQSIVAGAIQQAPCRAAAITSAAVAANPSDATGLVRAAVASAPPSAKAGIISAAIAVAPPSAGASIAQAGDEPGYGGISGAANGSLTNTGGFGAPSNNSAGTLNPANINGTGTTTVVPTNSVEAPTGG